MAYAAKIVLDSVSEAGDRLTTMEVTFPRMVLAEFNTHRMLSRNSASSRAIPFEKQVKRIREDPFMPVYWGKNKPGMQATEQLTGMDREVAISQWLRARDEAVEHAVNLDHMGLHKQTVNRLLEPWMWHTVIVTATEWSNFFALRANPDAQPEIRVIAERMQELYASSEPELIRKGEWHLPYIQPDERFWVIKTPEKMRKVSAARCARVSYLTHDGQRDFAADVKLYDRLVGGGHLSPLEHVAVPAWHVESTPFEYRVSGWDDGSPHKKSEWHGNFRGWKQLRKTIEHEDDFSKVAKG